MFFQLFQAEFPLHRGAVTYDMQTVLLKVDHSFAPRICHIGVADIPLFGHRPVEHGSATRNFMLLQRDELFDHRERLTNSITGDASTYGVQISNEVENLLTDF